MPGDFPEFSIPESFSLQMSARILDCIVCSLSRIVSYFLWKMTAKQAACLFLGDLTWNALAKSILVSLLEVKFLRLGTAGPELPEGSSGSFPTAPHCVLRTVPAGQSQENLWSRMFLWRISQRALTKEDSPSAINGKFALGTDPYPK